MKRLLTILTAVLLVAGCSMNRNKNPYENPFYAKYLNSGSPVDARISQTLDRLRADDSSAALHNDLGQLLVEKGFAKDAEREFERAVNSDVSFYPAWYNLGLVRASNHDEVGARRAFYRTVHHKPGHAAALFQLGLIEERRGNVSGAVDLFAKAYGINRALLDVQVNPRVLDSKLTHLALLQLYPTAHTRQSMEFNPTPGGYQPPNAASAAPGTQGASPQPQPSNIITPAPPATEAGVQKPVPQP